MNLKCISVLGLFVAFATAAVEEDCGENSIAAINAFKDPKGKVWNPKNNVHTNAFFHYDGTKCLPHMVEAMTGGPATGIPKSGRQLTDFKTALSKMSDADMRACHTEACHAFLAGVFNADSFTSIPERARKEMSLAQVKAIVASAKANSKTHLTKLDAAIPKELLEYYGPELINDLAAAVAASTASEKLFVKLFTRPETCDAVDAAHWPAIITSKNAAKLSPECMKRANLTGEGFDPKKTMQIPKESLKTREGKLDASFVKALGKDFIKDLAAEVPENHYPLANTDFTVLNKATGAQITQKLYLSHLSAPGEDGVAHTVVPTESVKNLSADLFKDLRPYHVEEHLRHVAPTEATAYPDALVKAIVDNYPRACSILSPKNYGGVEFKDNGCFGYMSGAQQGVALASAKSLPDNIFAKMTKDEFAAITVSADSKLAKGSENCAGVQIFSCLKNSPKNFGAIISHLGENPDGENPCEIFDFGTVDEHASLAGNISARCFHAATKEYPEEKDIKNARLLLLQPFNKLTSGKDFFKGIDSKKMASLSSTLIFCPHLTSEHLGQIAVDAFSGMSGACYNALTVRDKLTADQISKLAPSVFEDSTHEHLPPNVIMAMSVAQFQAAGKKVKDPKMNNIGRAFTDAAVAAMSKDILAVVTAENWAEAPADSFKGLKDLTAIPDSHMVHMKMSQVQNIATDVLKHLSAAQAKSIGASVTVPTEVVPSHLLKREGLDLSAEAREELVKRLPPGSDDGSGLGWIWIGVGVVVVLAVVGGAVFYFMRN